MPELLHLRDSGTKRNKEASGGIGSISPDRLSLTDLSSAVQSRDTVLRCAQNDPDINALRLPPPLEDLCVETLSVGRLTLGPSLSPDPPRGVVSRRTEVFPATGKDRREYVVKRVTIDRARQPDDQPTGTTHVQNLLWEAAVLATLGSPLAPDLIELTYPFSNFDSLRPAPLLVMERIPGYSLRAYFGDRPDPIEAIDLTISLLDSLDGVHRRGLVHIDIKPENVVVTLSGQARPCDFESARPIPDGPLASAFDAFTADLPQYDAYRSRLYASPESMAGRVSRADPRDDTFSAGVILYHLLTGRHLWDLVPYSTRNLKASFSLNRFGGVWPELDSAVGFLPSLPRALGEAIARATDPNPDGRFPTAAAFRDRLAEIRGKIAPTTRFTGTLVTLDPSEQVTESQEGFDVGFSFSDLDGYDRS